MYTPLQQLNKLKSVLCSSLNYQDGLEKLHCMQKSEGNLICPAERPNGKQPYTDFLQVVNGLLSLDKFPASVIISGKERA